MEKETKQTSRNRTISSAATNDEFIIENDFQIYYRPEYSSKLIDETDVSMRLAYEPKFASKDHLTGGEMRVVSKINTCKITLSKVQLEQLIKTLDNIVYEASSTSDSRPDYFTPVAQIQSNANMEINTEFKIEKLNIEFLADLEQPCQEFAELCFNEYELSIVKREKYVKMVNMSLKSVYLIDKLNSRKDLFGFEESDYLLRSYSDAGFKHSCSKSKIGVKYTSTPSLKLNSSLGSSDAKNFRSQTINDFAELTEYYDETGALSTSLPSERMIFVEKMANEYKELNGAHNCPSTPPPSPTSQRRRKKQSYNHSPHITKSESMSNLLNDVQANQNTNCPACLAQNSPLVNITINFVDKNHPDFDTFYSGYNKFMKIRFSDLKLNFNPETWIILLDLLGK